MRIRIAVLVTATAALITIPLLGIRKDSQQREWHAEQMERARRLALACHDFQVKEGAYPDRLERLISDRILTQHEFGDLRFQESPSADPSPWIYRVAPDRHACLLHAPLPVYRWKGHGELRIFALPDGMTKGVPESKFQSVLKQSTPE